MNKVKVFFVSVYIFSMAIFAFGYSELPIIPKPAEVNIGSGSTIFSGDFEFVYSKELSSIIDTILDDFKTVKSVKGSKRKIIFDYDNKRVESEAYRLKICENKIVFGANSYGGFFYAYQSLKQLALSNSENRVPNLEIYDSPKVSWRGMHIDIARHFISKKQLLKMIDLFSFYKFNRLHLHLTEDQGWRIEIKKYPRLTEIGAYREDTEINRVNRPNKVVAKGVYGGFLTQEDIKEIVKYAKIRNIEIIPEIDIPGHSQAAIAAYQYLGNAPVEGTLNKWGVNTSILNPSDRTIEFYKDVFDEIFELFPYDYIHLGGDEVPKVQWKNSEIAKAQMEKNNIESYNELQSWFINQISSYLTKNGKKTICWDEIYQEGSKYINKDIVIMNWRGWLPNLKKNVVDNDMKLIMAELEYLYFDYYQEKGLAVPIQIGGYTTLKKVYSFRPKIEDTDNMQNLLGTQGQLWTEYIGSDYMLEYMAFPRAIALSEVAWSRDENLDFNNFKNRLNINSKILDSKNVNYCRDGWIKKISTSKVIDDKAIFNVSNKIKKEGYYQFYLTSKQFKKITEVSVLVEDMLVSTQKLRAYCYPWKPFYSVFTLYIPDSKNVKIEFNVENLVESKRHSLNLFCKY